MKTKKPIEISLSEWQEIMQVPQVREGWGISDETPEEFAEGVYGVKFDFFSGSPGYVGDLYIIQADTLSGDPPVVLARQDGALYLVNEPSKI